MGNGDPLKDCCLFEKVYKNIGLVISVITLLFLIIVFTLVILIKGKQINELLLYVVIGEGLNNMIKIFFIFIEKRVASGGKTFKYIVTFFQVFSDFLSLIANALLSFMLFCIVKQNKTYKSPRALCCMRTFLFALAISFSIILIIFDNLFTDQKGNAYEDCNNWLTLKSISDVIEIVLIWTFIIIMVLMNIKIGCYLQAKKAKFDISEASLVKSNENTSTSERTSNSSESKESGISKKIKRLTRNLSTFPIITIVIWLLLTFDKIINRIIIFNYENHKKYETPCKKKGFVNFKQVIIIINIFLYNGKGLLYSFCFIKFQPAILMKLKELWGKLRKKNKEEEKDGLEEKDKNLVED